MKSRICRPLDGPRAQQPAAAEEPAAEVEAFDAAVEAAPVELEPEVEADFETGFEAGFSSTDFEAPTWATTQYEWPSRAADGATRRDGAESGEVGAAGSHPLEPRPFCMRDYVYYVN